MGATTGPTVTRLSNIFRNEQKVDENRLVESKNRVKESSKSEFDHKSLNLY